MQTIAERFAAELEYKYGIGLDIWVGLKILQQNKCAICGEEESAMSNSGVVKELAVDHDHDTGEVRGLLCMKCNTALGNLEEHLENAIKYIDKNHKEHLMNAAKAVRGL